MRGGRWRGGKVASDNALHVPLHIRPFHEADAPALRAVFESSVHTLAAPYYTPAERTAWAPSEHDAAQWAERMRMLQPFVAELDGRIAGFADLQPSGHIDMFFVAGDCGGRGVAKALMARIEASAHDRGIAGLWAHVSLAAEAFFRRSGFEIAHRREVTLRGVVLRNARMTRRLSEPCTLRDASAAEGTELAGMRPMTRPQAIPTVQIDNERTRVTEWRFAPGAETGHHRHGMDCVVVPMTTGTLLRETPQGTLRSPLTAGVSYTRLTGVEHNVINANDFEFVFVEIELK